MHRILLFALILLLAPQLGVVLIQGSYTNVLTGQHMNDASVDCTNGEDTTPPNVEASSILAAADCNNTTAAPLSEGAQFAWLPGITDSNWISIRYDNSFAAVSSGPLIWEGDLVITASLFDGSADLIDFLDVDDNPTYPRIAWYDDSPSGGDVYRLKCGPGASNMDYADTQWVEDIWNDIRIEFHKSDGPGDCTGLPADCDHCGCLLMDGVQVAECNSDTSSNDPEGWMAVVPDDKADIGLDRPYVCNQLVRPGTRCGDSDSFP